MSREIAIVKASEVLGDDSFYNGKLLITSITNWTIVDDDRLEDIKMAIKHWNQVDRWKLKDNQYYTYVLVENVTNDTFPDVERGIEFWLEYGNELRKAVKAQDEKRRKAAEKAKETKERKRKERELAKLQELKEKYCTDT